jgi:hypothetical protein
MSDPNFNFPALREAQGKLDAVRKELNGIFAQAGSNIDFTQVKGYGDKNAVLDRVRALNEQADELKQEVESLRDVARAASFANEGAIEKADGAGFVDVKRESFGNAFGKALGEAKSHKHTDVSLKGVEIKTLFERTAGWDPFDQRDSRVELTPLRPAVHVVNFIPQGTINQSDYKYMEETTHTATAVVEKAEAAAFGEAAVALTERSKPVEKIPAWIPVTDEQLEDEPNALAYLQNRLTQMIQRRLDLQVLQGTGVTPLLLGTEQVSGIQTQAKGTDTTIDAFRKLLTKFQDDGFAEPNVAFIAPSKWQDVVLTKTADGQYIWGHPAVQGPTTLWGVPMVPTTAVTSTKIVVGDYATYSMLMFKRGMDIQISNSHDTFFTSGKQAIRADIRAVLVHFRPKAFGTVTGL